MVNRYRRVVLLLVLLVILTGCLNLFDKGTSRNESSEETSNQIRINVEYKVRAPLGPSYRYNTTIIDNNETSYTQKTGKSVSEECIRELKELLLDNKVEPTCSENATYLQLEERIGEATEEKKQKQEELQDFKRELEQKKNSNQTKEIERLQEEIEYLNGRVDEINQTIETLKSCNTDTPEVRFVVSFKYPDSDDILFESPWMDSSLQCRFTTTVETQIGQNNTVHMSIKDRRVERARHIAIKIASISEDE